MGRLFEDSLWKDFSYTELVREIRSVRSTPRDFRDGEYEFIVSFFKKRRIIPRLLAHGDNIKLTYDLGHDDAFCQDANIPGDAFDDYIDHINLAVARLYHRLALESKDFEFVRGE